MTAKFVIPAVITGLIAFSAGLLHAQEKPAAQAKAKAGHDHKGGNHAAEENQKFLDPKLDVESYLERFESDKRDIYAQRDQIVKALALKPGQAVADIGAGTGLFSRLMAKEVGATGQVYAVEISPAFLKFIADRAKNDGQADIIKAVEGTQTSPRLKPESVDLIFTCATYHHFEKPEVLLKEFHKALKPGGRLVVIDFEMKPDSTEFVKGHARAPLSVYLKEMQSAGFEKLPDTGKPRPQLKENFFVELRKVSP